MGMKPTWMRPRKRNEGCRTAFGLFLMVVLLWGPGPAAVRAQDNALAQPLFNIRIPNEFPNAAASFEEVRELILKHYYTASIREEDLYWAAIEGMLRHVSPPGSPGLGRIWTPEAYADVRQSLEGTQVSIGVRTRFEKAAGAVVVEKVLPGSPAEEKLAPQDRILRIDGRSLKELRPVEVDALLDGAEGSEVVLTVNRDIEIFDIALIRKKFAFEPLTVAPLPNASAYMEVTAFTAGLADKIKTALADLSSSGTRRLIIDLRRNTGGVFMEGLRTAELFIGSKQILLRTLQRDTSLQNYVSSNAAPFHFDLAVLIGPQTASAAEIFAAALQDHGIALLIGEHTFGKGIVETTFPLANGCRVKFITGALYSPAGKSWQAKGVAPEFWIAADGPAAASLPDMTPEEKYRRDPAVITAYRLLAR